MQFYCERLFPVRVLPPAGIAITNISLELAFRNLLEFHFLPQLPSCPWLVVRGTFGSGSWRILLRLRCVLTSPLLMGACSTTKRLLPYPSEPASAHSLMRFLHSLSLGGKQAWLTASPGWQNPALPYNSGNLHFLYGTNSLRSNQ